MRKTISVAALLLALTCPAYAGDMQNDIAPPNPSTNVTQEPTTGGEMPNGIMQNDTTGSLTQIALDLLAALPSLL